ncbi:MAG: hypothetical protein LBG98_04015 [Puniceicoccales bacterium]|jgi:hypothetical protein|nr:hypothetical protein [Puniceicoccales bacterium]
MKPEYTREFEIIKEYIAYHNRLPDTLKILEQSRDSEVLCGLLDLFTKENSNIKGFFDELYRTLKLGFSPRQIIEALSENGRFDAVYEVASHMFYYICWFMLDGFWASELGRSYFPEFRQMFDKVRPKYAAEFLQGMKMYCDRPEEENMLLALRRDMRRWQRKDCLSTDALLRLIEQENKDGSLKEFYD